MIKAHIVCDSISETAIRLTTMVIELPAFMLLDLLPIREVSVTRRQMTADDALPSDFGCQTDFGMRKAAHHWQELAAAVNHTAKSLQIAPDRVDQRIIDRLLFPFRKCEIVATSSQWRTVCDQLKTLGYPEADVLVKEIGSCLATSTPHKLSAGDWHLPFVDEEDADAVTWHVVTDNGVDVLLTDMAPNLCWLLLTKVSVNRCRRSGALSSNRVEQIKNDLDMFSSNGDIFSKGGRDAYDHQATPDTLGDDGWRNANLHGNTTGWCQFRQVAQWDAWRSRKVEV